MNKIGLTWEQRFQDISTDFTLGAFDCRIIDSKGNVAFEQNAVEAPVFWTEQAVTMFASKYFRGNTGQPNRETSISDVIDRVVGQICSWGEKDSYFDCDLSTQAFEQDLRYILWNQLASFNSPVWFNLGVPEEVQQASACFVLEVQDDMKSIVNRTVEESILFRNGSGSGANNSRLRGSVEPLSRGGYASGPVSFMRGWDAFAGIIKSGGRTRRSAKIEILDVDHPDIIQFIQCKPEEEKKAWALKQAGLGSDDINEMNSVFHQNANHSVRISNEFMKAVQDDKDWNLIGRTGKPKQLPIYIYDTVDPRKYSGNASHIRMIDGERGPVIETIKARVIWEAICKSAHACGDPGLFFDNNVNKWNTVSHIGQIESSNPCIPANAWVLASTGICTFGSVSPGDTIWSPDGWVKVIKKWSNGIKPVYRYVTTAGVFLGTSNHRVFSCGEKIEVDSAESIDRFTFKDISYIPERSPQAIIDGLMVGDGYVKISNGKNLYPLLCIGENDQDYLSDLDIKDLINPEQFDKYQYRVDTSLSREDLVPLPIRDVPSHYITGSLQDVTSFLRGLYSANGSVVGKQRITLKATSLKLIESVQIMLSSIGIASYYTTNKPHDVKFDNGIYTCKESYDLNITTGRETFRRLIGFVQQYKQDKLNEACEIKGGREKVSFDIISKEYVGDVEVFDITVDGPSHSFWCNGLLVSNCAEFLFLNNTACNLASINLAKLCYLRDGNPMFDDEKLINIVETLIVAMDIIAGNADYPTEKIRENSIKLRPLGLGYCGVGHALMSMGIPYNSGKACEFMRLITGMMTAVAYNQSATLMEKCNFIETLNRHNMLRVIELHHESCEPVDSSAEFKGALTWDCVKTLWRSAIARGDAFGFRNAQTTLLAPTGTISFGMGIGHSTGIEPLVTFSATKKMAGKGTIVLDTDECLKSGLTAMELDNKLSHNIMNGDLASTDPALMRKINNSGVFDTALGHEHLGTALPPSAHINMMAAVQPFLSGGISKTVNLPSNSTTEDIGNTYFAAWALGLKAIAVYRDGSKFEQPYTVKTVEEVKPVPVPSENKRIRRLLPDERPSITHKAHIGGQKFYITAGMYPDTSEAAEVFITTAKEGSTVRGLFDTVATLFSICLQYGVPLETLIARFKDTRFEPNGVTHHPSIPIALSPIDYIVKWLEWKFLEEDEYVEGNDDEDDYYPRIVHNGTTCPECGGLAVRSGKCHVCTNCGTSTGCG